MTEKQRDLADSLPMHALWQWLAVTLSHGAARTRTPYIEPLLVGAEVIVHPGNLITVQFNNGSIVQLKLNDVDIVPSGGITLPLFS